MLIGVDRRNALYPYQFVGMDGNATADEPNAVSAAVATPAPIATQTSTAGPAHHRLNPASTQLQLPATPFTAPAPAPDTPSAGDAKRVRQQSAVQADPSSETWIPAGSGTTAVGTTTVTDEASNATPNVATAVPGPTAAATTATPPSMAVPSFIATQLSPHTLPGSQIAPLAHGASQSHFPPNDLHMRPTLQQVPHGHFAAMNIHPHGHPHFSGMQHHHALQIRMLHQHHLLLHHQQQQHFPDRYQHAQQYHEPGQHFLLQHRSAQPSPQVHLDPNQLPGSASLRQPRTVFDGSINHLHAQKYPTPTNIPLAPFSQQDGVDSNTFSSWVAHVAHRAPEQCVPASRSGHSCQIPLVGPHIQNDGQLHMGHHGLHSGQQQQLLQPQYTHAQAGTPPKGALDLEGASALPSAGSQSAQNSAGKGDQPSVTVSMCWREGLEEIEPYQPAPASLFGECGDKFLHFKQVYRLLLDAGLDCGDPPAQPRTHDKSKRAAKLSAKAADAAGPSAVPWRTDYFVGDDAFLHADLRTFYYKPIRSPGGVGAVPKVGNARAQTSLFKWGGLRSGNWRVIRTRAVHQDGVHGFGSLVGAPTESSGTRRIFRTLETRRAGHSAGASHVFMYGVVSTHLSGHPSMSGRKWRLFTTDELAAKKSFGTGCSTVYRKEATHYVQDCPTLIEFRRKKVRVRRVDVDAQVFASSCTCLRALCVRQTGDNDRELVRVLTRSRERHVMFVQSP